MMVEFPLSRFLRGLAAVRAEDEAQAAGRSYSEEARAYAFAADLVRRLGPDEAGRIADLVVRDVQMISRNPHP